MSANAGRDTAPSHLYRMALALFLSYLAVALSLSAVSVYVRDQWHFSAALGGLAVGVAFLSTILTRGYAGRLADQVGSEVCLRRGLMAYSLASLIAALSAVPVLPPALGYAVLVLGRLLLGLGESLTLVGILSWGIGLAGPSRSGKVMALVGMAMYGAFAVGGPVGLAVLQQLGFAWLMVACAVVPMIGLILLAGIPYVKAQAGKREPFWRILGSIWLEGATVGLQGVGFAALGAFISLYFLSHHWDGAGLGLTFFGVGFVIMRILCGHLPDRIGGIPVAIGSLCIEAVGQFVLWQATGPTMALLGALLTGLGCSMVFPAMGSEVVKRLPTHLRGTAVGGYAAFQDLAYGLTGPVTGVLADHLGFSVVFLVGTVAAVLGLLAAVTALRRRQTA